mmetsp:Transcript_4989/g.2783  ORF Transcript_4989/g.2783 Transcript_4989/m.2783 type:complete len:87 (+) Transcript_4989:423-683(+)
MPVITKVGGTWFGNFRGGVIVLVIILVGMGWLVARGPRISRAKLTMARFIVAPIKIGHIKLAIRNFLIFIKISVLIAKILIFTIIK